MKKEEFYNISGDLMVELKEISRLQETESIENSRTHTEDWGAFLTIYCC